jgi:hypothetical protein
LGHPNWVRLEVQVRPQKEARTVYNGLDADEVWGASPYTRELAKRVFKSEMVPFPAGTVYRPSSRDRALEFMCEQYGSHLLSLKQDLGSWECLGLTLRDMIARKRRDRE